MSSCGQKAVDGLQKITLRNGVSMPMIGYGTFQITDAKQCRSCVADALAAGYRLVDTAAAYGNEEAVGEAVRQSGIARSELFITTKLWVQDAGYDGTLKAFDRSLEKLGLSYLDLYLIHQPFSCRAVQKLRWSMISLCPISIAAIASISFSVRAKSKMTRFSRIRSGCTVLGMVGIPRW